MRKQAEADKYATQQQAEAQLVQRQRQADAELYEAQKDAEKQKAQAEAARYAAEQEAAGVQAKGEAEAAAISARLTAEADGLDKKAQAMQKYGQAAIVQMLVEALPEIAKNVAAPLANVDSITMYGDNNNSAMVGDVMTTMSKVSEGMGLDIPQLIQATLTGRAAGQAIAQTQQDTDSTANDSGK